MNKKKTGKSCTINFDKHMEVKQFIEIISSYNKMPIADYILELCINDYKHPNNTLKKHIIDGMKYAKEHVE